MKKQKKGVIALVLLLCFAVATVFATDGVTISRTPSKITVKMTASTGSVTGTLCVNLKAKRPDPKGKYHITTANFYYSLKSMPKSKRTDSYDAPDGYEITGYGDNYCTYNPEED